MITTCGLWTTLIAVKTILLFFIIILHLVRMTPFVRIDIILVVPTPSIAPIVKLSIFFLA